MVMMPALSRPHEQILEMGGQRWFLATTEQAREMGLKRSWDVDWIAEQGVDRSKPFVLDLDTFHAGYGYSHASIPGVYDIADGWDLSTPGKARTWPLLSTCESFGTVSDYRGWTIEHGGYMYVGRGRYVAKYLISDVPGSAPSIVGMHNVGSGMAVAGQMAKHSGFLYVPLVQISNNVLQRFHRLTTVITEVVEVQTIAMSGTPTGGTYTISYNDGVDTSTTSALAFDAASTVVQAALRLLPGLQKVTVVQSGTIPNFTHTITMTAAPGALASTSPPQFTSTDGTTGGTHAIAHATTVAGSADQWDLGPATILSRAFVAWFDKLTLADANNVRSATADPMIGGNWSAKYPVGDAGTNVTHLAVLGDDLLAGKPDGLWSFDESGHARPELGDLRNVVDAQNCIGAAPAQAALFVPHRAGLVRWRPGAFAYVGAEQEGYLEGDVSPHWGRVMGVAAYGKSIYYTVNGSLHAHGFVASLTPGAGRTASYIPHMSHHFDSPVEHCAVVALDRQATSQLAVSAPTDDSAVGTITWTNPGNAQTLDGVYATAAVGTSHYLKALLPAATRVPDGATVLGVEVVVNRRSWVYATPSYVAVASAAGSAVSTISPGKPPGTADGDVMVLSLLSFGALPNAPSGWTLAAAAVSIGGGGTDYTQYMYYKVAASEGASYNITTSGVWTSAIATIVTLRNVDTSNPLDTYSTDAPGFGTNVAPASLTVGAAGAAIVASFCGNAAGANPAVTWTPTTGAERADLSVNKASVETNTQIVAAGTRGDASTASGVANLTGIVAAFRAATLAGTVVDNVVKLVRAGSVVGDNKASATNWPVMVTAERHGGSGDLWGTTLTPAQINAADFGGVLSATNSVGEADVDAITFVVYYQPAGIGDPGAYLAVLTLDAVKTTCTPVIIKLGRAGLAPANDPSIDKAASDAEFKTSRYYAPDRSVSKVYRALTCWLALNPQANTPGVQVWATVDDGAEFQMLDGAGAAAEFTTSGAKRLFFPKTAAAVGHWVQFRVTVPALAGAEVALDATIRNLKVYGVYNPVMTQQVTMALILRQGQHSDGQRELRTPDDQAADLADLAKPQAAATTYKDPETGEDGYFDVQGPRITEMRFKSGQQTLRTAVVRALVQAYT